MQHSANVLYARDLEDPDVPEFVKQNQDNEDDQDFDESGDYETDEEYEISTRVNQDGKISKVAIPTLNHMNKSVSKIGKILHESFNTSKPHDNSANIDAQLMSIMKQMKDRPSQEKTLLVSMYNLMNSMSPEERNQILSQFGNTNSKQQKNQAGNLIHQKYRLSGKE